jgi:Lsr2
MATVREIRLVDDLDGDPADGTIELGLDGHTYEIDLSKPNTDRLHELLAPFVQAARRTRSRGPARRRRSAAAAPAPVDREQNQAMREWARQRGMKVADRGRVPVEIRDAYHAEHQ